MPIDDEGSVAHRVQHAPFLALGVEVGGDPLQHHDVVPVDEVDDPALDVGQALLDQRRPDEPGRQGREPEPRKLVRVSPGAGPDADHLVQQVDGGNGKHAFPVLAQRGEGVIPCPRGDGKHRLEIHHHGPGDGHDVVLSAVMGGHEDHRPWLDQREGLAQVQGLHGITSARRF